MFWSYLLHLSYNMWIDRPSPELVYAHHNALPYMGSTSRSTTTC